MPSQLSSEFPRFQPMPSFLASVVALLGISEIPAAQEEATKRANITNGEVNG
jgi:hypothetical protein